MWVFGLSFGPGRHGYLRWFRVSRIKASYHEGTNIKVIDSQGLIKRKRHLIMIKAHPKYSKTKVTLKWKKEQTCTTFHTFLYNSLTHRPSAKKSKPKKKKDTKTQRASLRSHKCAKAIPHGRVNEWHTPAPLILHPNDWSILELFLRLRLLTAGFREHGALRFLHDVALRLLGLDVESVLLLRCRWRGAFVMKTGLLGSRPAVDDSWRGAEGIREWSSKHDFLSLFVCFSSKIWSLSCSCEEMMKTTTTMRRRRTMMGGGGKIEGKVISKWNN